MRSLFGCNCKGFRTVRKDEISIRGLFCFQWLSRLFFGVLLIDPLSIKPFIVWDMRSYLAQLQSFVNDILRGFVCQYGVCGVANDLRYYYQPSCGLSQSHLAGFATLSVILARWDRFRACYSLMFPPPLQILYKFRIEILRPNLAGIFHEFISQSFDYSKITLYAPEHPCYQIINNTA